jgi:hypothetical protein
MDFGWSAIRGGERSLLGYRQRARGPVLEHPHRWFVALSKSVDLLRDAVFSQTNIARLQSIDVVALAVSDREAQDHHVHLHPKGGPLLLREKRQGNQEERRGSANVYPTIELQDCPPKIIRLFKTPGCRYMLARFLAYFIAHQPERAQQRRPVFQVGGKNPFHGLTRPIRDQNI